MADDRNTRLPGHGLQAEGKACEPDPGYAWRLAGEKTGRGLCKCGEQSPVLYSDNARKAWHRGHKARIRREQGSGTGG